MTAPVFGTEVRVFFRQPLQGGQEIPCTIEAEGFGIAIAQDRVGIGRYAAFGKGIAEVCNPGVQAAQRSRHPLALPEQTEELFLRDPVLETTGQPSGAEIFGDHAVDVRETVFSIGLEQPDPERVACGLAEPEPGNIGEVEAIVGGSCMGTRVDARATAQDLGGAEHATCQQQFVVASPGMCILMVTGIVFPEHHTAGAIEELGTGFGKPIVCPCNLAQHPQGQGIAAEGLDSTIREMTQEIVCIDIRELP